MSQLKFPIVILAAAVLPLTSCQNFPTGGPIPANENIVVNAEKTLAIAKETFDTFLKIEYDNRDLIKAQAPTIHNYANYIRKNAPDWLLKANTLKNNYKHSGIDLANLQSILATITSATAQSKTYITEIQTKSLR